MGEFYRHRGMASGRLGMCRTCSKAIVNRWRRTHPDEFTFQRRRRELRQKYGLTPQQYEDMLHKQGGLCACCGKPPGHAQTKPSVRYLAVDHCHRTGRVRGLLCVPCNLIIGNACEDDAVLRAAISYLAKIKEAQP